MGELLEQLLEQVLTIAYDAGDAIMAIYGNEYSVEIKEDHSPVTEADKAAHHPESVRPPPGSTSNPLTCMAI